MQNKTFTYLKSYISNFYCCISNGMSDQFVVSPSLYANKLKNRKRKDFMIPLAQGSPKGPWTHIMERNEQS